MMRTSQAIFLLLGALALPLASSNCSSSSLSGGNALTGSKDKDKDKDKPSDDGTTDGAQGTEEGGEEGTDAPVWVNASYLTCVPEKAKSDDANVAVLCGLDDADGKPIKPDDTKVEWHSQSLAGDKTEDEHENASTEERFQGRFYFPGALLAKRAVLVQFNGGAVADGKKLTMTEALKGLEENGELLACLEAADAVAKDCIFDGPEADKNVPLTKVRAFVMSTINTGLLGGIDGADLKCTEAATSASLTGKYRALLSSDAQDAVDLVAPGLPIVEAYNGIEVATDRNALFLSLPQPFVKDESGANVGDSAVWTGSNAAGKKTVNNCQNWTSNSASDRGTVGRVGQINHDWLYIQAAPATCVAPGHLYCIEVQ